MRLRYILCSLFRLRIVGLRQAYKIMGACHKKCGTCPGAMKTYEPPYQAPQAPRMLYTSPVVGVAIKAPKVPPGPGDILLGYELKPAKVRVDFDSNSSTVTGTAQAGSGRV